MSQPSDGSSGAVNSDTDSPYRTKVKKERLSLFIVVELIQCCVD